MGWVGPPSLMVKNREKNDKCNQYELLQVLPKSPWINFKINFETLSALGTCHVTIIGGILEVHDFRGFLRISQQVYDISS